jgi:hypothetical protein
MGELWIENTGKMPDCYRVDIRLTGATNFICGPHEEWYDVCPGRWDWQRNIGGVEITHFRISQ